ncbi:hypothetical protein VZG28_05180 [Synechococcus elongatus IITB4]|uniref:hypothetical protein n=1 Tax=Synechococcus elongatus TaxID=32046 RepID=UPI0030D479BD
MNRRQKLKREFFFQKPGTSWSDLYVSDRIRLDMVEMILRDVASKALEMMIDADEFGVLIIRPHQDDAVFMTKEELAEDRAIAEGADDGEVISFLTRLLEALEKIDPREKVPIALCDHLGFKLFLVDTKDPVAPLRGELQFSYGGGRDVS